jgi:hypothetical protein
VSADREAQVRRVRRRATAAGLMIAVCLGLTLSGCGTAPHYRYIGSSDRDLVLRVPRNWSAVNTDDALKATGVDPATVTDWAVFYDASSHPDVKHVTVTSADQPQLFAQSIKVSADERSTVTTDELRDLMLPGTADARQAATAAGAFAMVENKTEKTAHQQGVHIIYTYKVGSTNEYFDRIALTDPKRKAVHVVFVHCNQQCFAKNKTQIEDAVTSLTLK